MISYINNNLDFQTASKDSTTHSVSSYEENKTSLKQESIASLGNQRTMDLLKNITKHAPPKKLRVFREAMVNAEGLKIKKFNDK